MLLIVDGLHSHFSDECLQVCFIGNIQVVKLPPHCSHVLQPLDVCIFRSYAQRIGSLRKHPHVLRAETDQLSKAWNIRRKAIAKGIIAFQQAAIPSNVITAFADTGLYPLSLHAMVSSTNHVLGISSQEKQAIFTNEVYVNSLFEDFEERHQLHHLDKAVCHL